MIGKKWVVGLVAVVVLSWVQDGVAATIFFDDFNDGNADGWTFPHVYSQYPGVWSVDDGILVQHTKTDNNVGLVDNLLLSDQLIATQTATNGYTGVVLWYDQVGETAANFVSIAWNPDGWGWRVHEYLDGEAQTISYDGPHIPKYTWYDMAVVADSALGTLTVYVDDEFVFTHTASTSCRTGLSGVYSGNEVGYFDNFRVSPVPEPTTLAIWSALGGLGLIAARRRKRTA